MARSDEVFESSIVPSLASAGLYFTSIDDLDATEKARILGVFEKEIFPVLTPLAVDPGHPFPYISNLSLNLAVLVEDPITREQRFARVKVPPLLPRFVPLNGGVRFVALEQLIAANLPRLFPHMEIGRHHAFRVTRNADLDLEESEADDLLAAVETELRRRRFGRAVRLEVDRDMPTAVRDLLLAELELGTDDVFESSAPLGLGQLWALHAIDRADLHEAPWVPMTQPRLATAGDGPVDLFSVLRERSVLVHHPYDSFTTSVEAFITQAADDPNVLAIKQTLYRTSDDTAIVSGLPSRASRSRRSWR
jgi:polyphosphate kinase